MKKYIVLSYNKSEYPEANYNSSKKMTLKEARKIQKAYNNQKIFSVDINNEGCIMNIYEI